MSRFVIQEHRARSHHFDFRLEKDGVFKSWAVPKGIPDQLGIRRLAVQVEDHRLEFGDFQGSIPPGEYGAGTIQIWDTGEYELAEWSESRVAFTLKGNRANGKYIMVRFREPDVSKWLLIKDK